MASKKNGESKEEVPVVNFVSDSVPVPSGVSLIDLACTDSLEGFCNTGHGVNIIGDRNSGKTILALASMAETYRRYGDKFDYDFYDAENAFSFDTPRLFGKEFAQKLNVIPVPTDISWCTEALTLKMMDDMEKKRRFIVIDSIDALRPHKEFEVEKERAEGKRIIDPRAIANSYMFRLISPKLAETGSFLIYLSQAREQIGGITYIPIKTRSGGKCLGYNAFVEMWLSPGQQIKEDDVKVGNWTTARIERSKANGKKRTVSFPVLPAYGIDDTRANIDWLSEENVLKKTMGVYDLSSIGIDYKGKNPYLFIEEKGLTGNLIDAVKKHWEENERHLVDVTFGGRKPRYE